MWIHKDHPQIDAVNNLLKSPLSREASLEDLIRRPEVSYAELTKIEGLSSQSDNQQALEQVEIQIKYAGYISRQQEEIEKQLRHEQTILPADYDYSTVSGLSNEVVAKLTDVRPQTIGQASRISGITPAAISLLLVYLKKQGLIRKLA